MAPAPVHEVCVIGPQITVKGEITGDEDITVEGSVEGLIQIARDVRVGEKGRVKARVEARTIIIAGEVVGDCHASVRVEIQASGRLTGDIRAPRIVVAEGAMFRGNSDMSGRPPTPPPAAG
jgi:cytoskeletal protein CcmA (bactofilin family)